MKYEVLLYYKYIDVVNPDIEVNNQRNILSRLNLKGRVLIATEGINGTVCGTSSQCDEYISYMNLHSIFNEIDFKKSSSDFICFSKLIVKLKKEIVVLGIDPKDMPASISAETIMPSDFHNLMNKKKDEIVIFDTRNLYESRIGKFYGAIAPDIKTSREFKDYFEDNKNLFKDKDVVMYCTGGVRCERISILLDRLKVAKKVRHLKGGIHKYVEKYPDGYFRGSNYVFDDRITQKINDDILSNCDLCNILCDRYNNCLNAICNKHYLCCDSCFKNLNGNCSERCKDLTEKKLVPLRPPLASRKFNLDKNENIK
jgi:UPF0176 protein